MANPFEKYLANGLADFEGLRISGSVPVKQEVINEVLAEVLKAAMEPKEPKAPAAAPSAPATPAAASNAKLEPRTLLKHLKHAEVKAQEGRLVLEFDLRIE